MISWNNPKEFLPNEGEVVAVIYRHWKDNNNPMCYEIMVGRTSYSNDKKSCRVESDDYTGKGGWSVYLKNAYSYSDDVGIGWCQPDELDIELVKKNKEWVKEIEFDVDETS